MGTITAIIILLLAVVVANIIHLQWPVIPLAIYQLIIGVVLAFLPLNFDPGHLVTEPELFMMLVIAPLLFNEGQNQSFRNLRKHSHVILSVAVALAIMTVLIAGSVLHLLNPATFSLAIAFMLAAIITPTDAVAVKSITTGVSIPDRVNDSLNYESLFNDASGIVLFDLAVASLQSGDFSLGHGIGVFLYVFFGGLIFGAIIGSLMVGLRRMLSAGHANIGNIVIPINLMTPLITFWAAEEIGCSGILAVVAAGIVHSVFYDQMHLESTRTQLTSSTLWEITEDALNGLVFVLLGAILPNVLGRTSLLALARITVVALILYLVMTVLRYLWARLGLVSLQDSGEKYGPRHASLVFALSGIHGTITMAMAFSIPVVVSHHHLEIRNTLILISAMVILISLAVGAIALPLLLPKKQLGYSKEEFSREMGKAVKAAITQTREAGAPVNEIATVVGQLRSQVTQYQQVDRRVFRELLFQCQKAEVQTLQKMRAEETISRNEEIFSGRQLLRSLIFSGYHGWANLWRFITHHFGWSLSIVFARHVTEPSHQRLEYCRRCLIKAVNQCLKNLMNENNRVEIGIVKYTYSRRAAALSQAGVDEDRVNQLFLTAFQAEESYVQTHVASGKINQELANALNAQITLDQLSYIQSAD